MLKNNNKLQVFSGSGINFCASISHNRGFQNMLVQYTCVKKIIKYHTVTSSLSFSASSFSVLANRSCLCSSSFCLFNWQQVSQDSGPDWESGFFTIIEP